MFDNVCREEIFMMNTVICLFTNDNMLVNIWRKYSDNWMVLWTSVPTLKISKNINLLHYIENNFLHTWTNPLPLKMLLKTSKTIWTNLWLCYAQLVQTTTTLLGPVVHNRDQATKCGLVHLYRQGHVNATASNKSNDVTYY